jgi:ribosomal protein S12 methylthiotransferase
MSLQRRISRKKNKALIGQELEVLVEGPSEESELVMAGRHPGQAPEIDGSVYLSGGPVQPGDLCRARVTSAEDYDLVAEVLERTRLPGPRRARAAPPLVHQGSDGRRVLRTVP